MKKQIVSPLSSEGHRSRIKEKYHKFGLEGWLDYEVLEFILSYAIARKDTKVLSKELLNEFKTINGVLDADVKDLENILGLSEHTVLFLKLLKDVSILYMKQGLEEQDLLSSPERVYDYLKTSMKGLANEEFHMLFLNSQNKFIKEEVLKTGTVDRAVVFPRNVVERALYHHAVSVIIAHNHPSGSIKPSQEDRLITKAIKSALKTVDIALLDHIVIGGTQFFSFKEETDILL